MADNSICSFLLNQKFAFLYFLNAAKFWLKFSLMFFTNISHIKSMYLTEAIQIS